MSLSRNVYVHVRGAYQRTISMSIDKLVWSAYLVCCFFFFFCIGLFIIINNQFTIYLYSCVWLLRLECTSIFWSIIYEILIYYFIRQEKKKIKKNPNSCVYSSNN